MAQITDRDLSLWIKGLACRFHLDDLVAGSGVSPLALQKPARRRAGRTGGRGDCEKPEILSLRVVRLSGRDLVVTQHGVVPAVVNETFRI